MARGPRTHIPKLHRRERRKGRWLNPKLPVDRMGFWALPYWLLTFAMQLVITFILVSLVWVIAYRFTNPPTTATMIADRLAGRGAARDWMPIEQIDRDMVRAAIAAEDGKYCTHNGFDIGAIQDAMKRNASGGRIRGGSTISQQTAKNAFLWQGGGYFRKGMEAWFTLLIEQFWGKQRIMEVYLNLAETGIGTYGVNAGSQRYFGHDASAMSRTEAARIAAVLPLPKKRGAITPKGFTRRYGNTISARVGSVASDGLDSCVYADIAPPKDKAPPKSKSTRTLPGEEYESARTLPPLEDVAEDLPESLQPAGNETAADLVPEDAPGANEPEATPAPANAVEESL